MKRSLLTLALIIAAGAAGAQTNAPAPAAAAPDVATKGADKKISTEAAAKAALEADGYSSIGSLRMGADGKWSGSAMRGNKQVAVSVDPDGQVSPK